MSARDLKARIERLVAEHAPRCHPGRLKVVARPGQPDPELPPCPGCGDPECGLVVIKVEVVGPRRE